MENQANVEFKISCMRFSGELDECDKRYISYIWVNKYYWLSVDVTKDRPFGKFKRLPRDGLIPSLVAYICFAATTFEIIFSRKVRTKRKKIKKGKSIDGLSNFKIQNK